LNDGRKAGHSLSLVSAPAGFGKTTLVVDWLRQSGVPAAWLSLDEADNELPRFLAYLAAALQEADEEIGAPLLSAFQSPQPPSADKAQTSLLNEIARRVDPLILVLDDYHLLSEPPILQVMDFLVQHQPPPFHLVLTTREDPDLPLARLRGRDQITEIRTRDLRFTRHEVDVFLKRVMGLEITEAQVAVLEERTEGWVAGLQLAGLSLQGESDPAAFLAEFSGSHRYILDYLTEEVLQHQPAAMRSFLLQISILDRLSGPLCDAVTGRRDSEAVLRQMDASNLFVVPLDEERRWYRYHHLFADLLHNQLTRSQPEAVPELHGRASRWYEKNGDIDAAVGHALQASDLPLISRLIEQHTLPKLYRGEVTKVVAWFDRLPEAALESAPMLCICKAWALSLLQRGARRQEAEAALHAAELALDRANADDALRALVAGHAASIRGFLLRIPALKEGRPLKLVAVSQQALALLPPEAQAIRSTAALNMGYGYLGMADLEAASVAFFRTLEDGLSGGNYYAAIYGPVNLILCALLEGRLRDALQMSQSNIDRFNRVVAGRYFPPIGALHILKGNVLLECGRLEEAEQALTEGLDLVRWIGETVAPRKGYTALARLRAIQGDRPAAMEAVKTLEETWPEGALYAQALRHRLSIRHWPDDPKVRNEARSWLERPEIGFASLAAIAGVDPFSTSIFEFQINAVHVLARWAKDEPGWTPAEGVRAGLNHVRDFAVSHGFIAWSVEVALAGVLLDQAAGRKAEALETLETALRAATETGLRRIFLDEVDPLQALLRELKPRLTDAALLAYVDSLLDGMGHAPDLPTGRSDALLSPRELEVLRCLAQGLSYEETGRHLFLSLNTVQFHVKNIYGKLGVNRRQQATEKAREMSLI
jgi:LuxR family maltose regulon positive regulatory protein